MLGLSPWKRQEEILRAVAKYPRVAVRSGHKIGKSTSACALALWWVLTRKDARVIMTSASGRQVRAILWRELRRLYYAAPMPVGGVLHESPSSGLRLPDGREVLGFSTDQPERMAGISGQNVLFILDEASGIPEPIFEAIEGNRAGGARIVMFSNPTRTSGTFYEAFTSKRDFWHCIKVSSRETPNATGRGTPVPGLATREWIEEKREEWGEHSPLFAVRVEGDFPTQSEAQVIGLSLVDEARVRWESLTPGTERLFVGVDPARYGDDATVIQAVRGRYAYPPVVLRNLDTVQVAEQVLAEVKKRALPGERPRVKVDVIGIGAGVYDHLRRKSQIEACAVNVAERATAEGFVRLRDQIWFALADWLRDGGSIPPDSALEAELVAPLYSIDSQGRRKVESKDEIKSKLKRSPDRADALCLAVYNPPQRPLADLIQAAQEASREGRRRRGRLVGYVS